MTVGHFFSTYIDPLAPIAAVAIAYVLGRSVYFRQKEYELITERYLGEGLDRVTAQVERSLGQFRHNWARGLTLVKMFREAGKDMNRELYKGGFIEPDPSLWEIWTDYRIRDLTGDDIINVARQALDAFVRTSHAFLAEDLCTTVRLAVEGGQELKLKAKREEIVSSYFDKLRELDTKAKRYYNLLGELQKIASALQTQRFSFKRLGAFKRMQSVRDSVKALHNEFDRDRETPLPQAQAH